MRNFFSNQWAHFVTSGSLIIVGGFTAIHHRQIGRVTLPIWQSYSFSDKLCSSSIPLGTYNFRSGELLVELTGCLSFSEKFDYQYEFESDASTGGAKIIVGRTYLSPKAPTVPL